MDRHTQMIIQRGRPVSTTDAAQANEDFEFFLNASTLKTILGHYRNICDLLHLKPNVYLQFYPKLRANLTSWRAKALWKKFDLRSAHKCYGKGKACSNVRVLIIGGGPCGLRTAIEAQLLGAKVVVVEKRDRMSRNNVLHLWPFVIEDLRALGAKKFFGKFCAGSIDHISIRQLQCILLKAALLLGVEVHTEVSFERLIEPNITEKSGWRAECKPANHPVSQYEFDVIIGADGKRNTLQGFKRKEFRGKLAIAITANFINRRTEAEAIVEEISGVAFIFNQKFFKDLYDKTGIDLENIVYYKDDTHYFVMTAKKPSLIAKGVIKQDLADTERLLAPDNVNKEALMNYAREAAEFSTKYNLPDLEFAVNHYGQPDIAMFDFTSMYAAENASKVLERNGYQLLMILVGDSLLEPFWPTGSGCARGFLSSLDAAWAIRSWGSGTRTPLEVLAERESIYRLLAQTTPDNLNKDWKSYTLDPSTRYPNLNRNAVLPLQTVALYDTDNKENIEKLQRNSQDLLQLEKPKKRRREEIDNEVLVTWVKDQLKEQPDLKVSDILSVFKDGRILCAILSHYRPDLLDYSGLNASDCARNNQLAFDILQKEYDIVPVMTGEEMMKTDDTLTVALYLSQVYDTFRCEIPHIKHTKLENTNPTLMSSVFPKPPCKTISPTFLSMLQNVRSKCIKLEQEPTHFTRRTPFDYWLHHHQQKNNLGLLAPVETKPFQRNLPNSEKGNPIDNTLKITRISNTKYARKKQKNFGMLENKFSYFDENFNEIEPMKSTVQKDQFIFRNTDQIDVAKSKVNVINIGYVKTNRHHKSKHVLAGKPNIDTQKKAADMRRHEVPLCLRCLKNPAAYVKNKKRKCHMNYLRDKISKLTSCKFLLLTNMSGANINKSVAPEQVYDRVVDWISSSDFLKTDEGTCKIESPLQIETNIIDGMSDITSVTKCLEEDSKIPKVVLDDCTHLITCIDQDDDIEKAKQNSKSTTVYSSPRQKLNGISIDDKFSIILEEESELSEIKRSEPTLPKVAVMKHTLASTMSISRPSSRHKRHVESSVINKPLNLSDRKMRKRKTMEKEERLKCLEEIAVNRLDRQNKRRLHRKMQTEQFIKSMQMLQVNAKPDSATPFEDYSIVVYRQTAPNFEERVKDLEKKFTYVPDRENKVPVQARGEKDEDFTARIKDLEEKWKEPVLHTDKKPKDLLRAIGKIDGNDWNIKEIEKKILENKLGKTGNKDKEKVPKWSREQFLARQTKMEKQHLDRQDSSEAKYAIIDKNIKLLDQRLKEGSVRDLGQNKVATITEKLVPKSNTVEVTDARPLQKSNSRMLFPSQQPSEFCHFCTKRVYLMERLSAEGRFFHHGCFRCQYCNTQLRLGSYSFDKDGQFGYKFFCVHHYGMQDNILPINKSSKNESHASSTDSHRSASAISHVDLLDRVQTPERVEFSNLTVEHVSSGHEDLPSQIDEDEWTDRNFGASTAEVGSSDDLSSSLSDTDSDDEDAYEEALEEPATKEGTLKWAERWKRKYMKNESNSDDYSSDNSGYYENSSEDDDSDTATEGEEEIRARELRKKELCLEPPVCNTDTGTDTEVISDESSSDSTSEKNSATEISTDSEFAHDEPTPTSEVPMPICLRDVNVTKTRGSYTAPKKIQVKSGFLQKPVSGRNVPVQQDIQLKLTPLVPSPAVIRKPALSLLPKNEGYALNRTQSTGGIAAKVSLELKKKYLLGENNIISNIQKSGSASTLDSKLKSFHSNISDCQRLLKANIEANKNNSMQLLSSNKTDIDREISKNIDLPTSSVEVTRTEIEQEEIVDIFKDVVNECEGRPRSPLHETSITVPKIFWNKENDDSDGVEYQNWASNKTEQIPRVEIHGADGEIVQGDIQLDSLCLDTKIDEKSVSAPDAPKSVTSVKKELNRPKTLPNLDIELPEVHSSLHMKNKSSPEPDHKSSGHSTPSNDSYDQITTALTETELSDWARDGAVSDDFEDEYEIGPSNGRRKDKKPKNINNFSDRNDSKEIEHVCGKDLKENKNCKSHLVETFNDILNHPNLDNIEFMDTGSESNSEDEQVDISNKYEQFRNEDEMFDSLTQSCNIVGDEKNTGYCFIANDSNKFGSTVIDLKPFDLIKAKLKQNITDNDEDSLLIVETGTTTEENTCSDSTVKNVAEFLQREEMLNSQMLQEDEEKSVDKVITSDNQQNYDTNCIDNKIEYEKHCQRLQSKVEFGNAKDSINIRKARRKSKSESPPKPDLIQEENLNEPILRVCSPALLYKKEVIQKERDVNQKLVQEMVLQKMKTQNKSLERKKRNRYNFSLSSIRPVELSKSATTTITTFAEINKRTEPYVTPDVLLPAINNQSTPLQKSQTISDISCSKDVSSLSKNTPLQSKRPLSLYSKADQETMSEMKTEVHSMQIELRQNARQRVQMLSNEELGLSPEDKLTRFREKLNMHDKENINSSDTIETVAINTERPTKLYLNDTLNKRRLHAKIKSLDKSEAYMPARTKSVSEITKNFLDLKDSTPTKIPPQFCKSDPNLSVVNSNVKKKKDIDRRKSITKLFTTLFSKKKEVSSPENSPTPPKGILTMITPKMKDKAKDAIEDKTRRKSASEIFSFSLSDSTFPPPIPPLPASYTEVKLADENSDVESEWKCRSSCDTIDQSGKCEGSSSSLTSRRTMREAKKAVRHVQLKRHRMAQEIQRKLEETEVKTRELEERGVAVEKALRGEILNSGKSEPDLLQEWFDLMRDRTELRRYERELMVRAQELQLEDRHARLQHELRDRLDKDIDKNENDPELERSIINEMMEIVAKRDSLIALLEEDRLRYSEEDRDFEEKILAKGLQLTPFRKTPEK